MGLRKIISKMWKPKAKVHKINPAIEYLKHPRLLFQELAAKHLKKNNVFIADASTHHNKLGIVPHPDNLIRLYKKKYNYGAIYNYFEKGETPTGCVVFEIKNKELFKGVLDEIAKKESHHNISLSERETFTDHLNLMRNILYGKITKHRKISIQEEHYLRQKIMLEIYNDIGLNLRFIPNEGYQFNKEKIIFEKK